jgi:hypothetical protein
MPVPRRQAEICTATVQQHPGAMQVVPNRHRDGVKTVLKQEEEAQEAVEAEAVDGDGPGRRKLYLRRADSDSATGGKERAPKRKHRGPSFGLPPPCRTRPAGQDAVMAGPLSAPTCYTPFPVPSVCPDGACFGAAGWALSAGALASAWTGSGAATGAASGAAMGAASGAASGAGACV